MKRKQHDTNYRILVRRNDGGLSIVYPTGEQPKEKVLEQSLNNIKGGYGGYTELTESEFNKQVPKDRHFREAWTLKDNKLMEDPEKCRECIRKVRNKALQMLDKVAFAELRKPNGNIKEVERKAKKMRDLPARKGFKGKRSEMLKLMKEARQVIKEVEDAEK